MTDKPNLLLFDDDENTVDITKDALEDFFIVTWVSTKAELDENIERDHYDVIVTDVSIETSPQSGYEMVDELRRKYRVTRTPVVVYSAVRNVSEIKKSQNRLFYSYVAKVGRDWQKKLVDECKKAAKTNRNLVSWNVFEAYFEKIGKLDSIIQASDMPDAFIMGIDLGTNPTIKSVIALLQNPEIDDGSWETLENTLWKIYCKFVEQR